MRTSAQKNDDLYNDARLKVSIVNEKVIRILKNNEIVVISNADMMPCYKYI